MPYTTLRVDDGGLALNMETDPRFLELLTADVPPRDIMPYNRRFAIGEGDPGVIEIFWYVTMADGRSIAVDVYGVKAASTFTSTSAKLPAMSGGMIQVISGQRYDAATDTTVYTYSRFSTSQVPLGVSIFGTDGLPKFNVSNTSGSGGTGLTIAQILGSQVKDLLGGTDLSISGTSSNDTLVMPNGQSGEMSGGMGSDTVMGGAFADRVYGEWLSTPDPNGNDHLFGEAGNDELRGGAGADRMYGGLGADTFDERSDQQRGAGNDLVFGGSSVPFPGVYDVDTVRYSGARSNYTLTDVIEDGVIVTRVRNRTTGEVDKLSEIEWLQFDDLSALKPLKFPSKVLDMAYLAAEAYGDKVTTRGGWMPVHANELMMPTSSSGLDSDFKWTFQNGVFRAKIGLLPSVFGGDAQAHVLFGRGADGKITLAISFEGTEFGELDITGDIVGGWGPQMAGYFEYFRPLVDGVARYIANYPVSQVLVTGHSLGGAMAQYFMGNFSDTASTKFLAATFGSPGAASSLDASDGRIIHFEHTEDIVPSVGGAKGYPKQGMIVHVPLDNLRIGDDDGLGAFEHDIGLYAQSIKNFWNVRGGRPEFMTASSFTGGNNIWAVAGSPLSDWLAGSELGESIWGGGGNDQLFGLDGSDDVFGGNGNDLIAGGDGKDFLRGGAGADTFEFGDGSSSPGVANSDVVSDFSVAEDLISVIPMDANVSLFGDQAFKFIGSAAFSGAAGELRVVVGSTTRIEGNVDSDLAPEVFVLLSGSHAITAANLLL